MIRRSPPHASKIEDVVNVRIGLRGRILLFFIAIAVGSMVALALGLWFGYHRQGNPEMFNAFMHGAVAAGFGILAIVTWIWFLFDTYVARPIGNVASAMRAHAHAHIDEEMETADARYLGDLAAAASAAAATLAHTRNSLAQSVARETARLSSDKSKLEQLLADVPPAVLLCTGRHHLVFYNGVAQRFLAGAQRPVCLDRNLFDYLSDGAIRDAHHRLMEADAPDAVVEFICMSPCGSRRLAGRMRLIGDNGGDSGAYVMTLRDVTSEVAAYARRDVLLSDVFERFRPVVATLRQFLGEPDKSKARDTLFAVEREVAALDASLGDIEQRFEACRSDGWPMAPADARELAHQLQRELADEGINLAVNVDPVAARCNAFDIVSLFAYLARLVADRNGVKAFRLAIREERDAATLALSWTGSSVSGGELKEWLAMPVLEGGPAADAILAAHATQITQLRTETESGFGATLKPIERLQPISTDLSRTVVYDFDLLSRVQYEKIAEAQLDDLTYVVFDTETTGLLPEQGDEIVQIAAVRIVNGKRVKGEMFEALVNPGRAIPASASAVHGVTDSMVANAPDVREVVERFHKFAEGAVLVAHNAPFDMEFLYRRERELGIRFVNPVLDTVLLSTVVFGQSETHTLDALARRLAIPLTEAERHTAMGDAVATAEAFIKLKAMLMGRGLQRFGEVLTEIRRRRRLVADLNEKVGGI
ncbi:3'-5' exonuclease [Neorhizobium petrolearium]|uniref:DNA-directed DNA polymerase n=1 Tax=Neorhizobium petrolearium TaxID=515361 RepID=A0ABY8M132_9HYPH|nr:3'-5' exonuclease [Neorhizobium petrolearium]MCC2612944.1 3'-5' exonuclease [Neorhizobium petrolearium]WGI68048.1 3'-5' exonuclease [Neorhizobium petrolearium]